LIGIWEATCANSSAANSTNDSRIPALDFCVNGSSPGFPARLETLILQHFLALDSGLYLALD
jgi:hypothetical protein